MSESRETDEDVIKGQYRRLLESRLNKDVSGLVSLAVDRDVPQSLRLGALHKLRKVADSEVMPQLLTLIEDEDPGVRLMALRAIAAVDGPQATGVLRSALTDLDPVTVAWAVVWLERRRELPAADAAALLHSDDRMVRCATVKALRRSGDRSVTGPLRQLAARERGRAKVAAIIASLAVARRRSPGDTHAT